MNAIDFEIAKKELAGKIATLVSAFVKKNKVESIDVSAFLTDSDVSITESGKTMYGRMLHCIVDADIDSKEEDYE